jgi:hypothetical protein
VPDDRLGRQVSESRHTARIGREEHILLAETSMDPLHGDVLGGQTSDFDDQPGANLRRGFRGKNGARRLQAIFFASHQKAVGCPSFVFPTVRIFAASVVFLLIGRLGHRRREIRGIEVVFAGDWGKSRNSALVTRQLRDDRLS